MLNALLLGNIQSGAGAAIQRLDLPGRWRFDLERLEADDCRSFELIAIFGGDGTVQRTLTRLLSRASAQDLPPIAVLPFGTTNMTANDLNETRARRRSVARLEQIIETGTLRSVERSMVRLETGGATAHGFFFGIGAIASAVEAWNAERAHGAWLDRLRTLRALLLGLRTTAGATRIRLNGRAECVYGLLATTLERLLFGARPYWGGGERALRVTWLDADVPRLLRHAPALLRGSSALAGRPGFHSERPPVLRLEFDGAYTLDGELYATAGRELVLCESAPIRWVRL